MIDSSFTVYDFNICLFTVYEVARLRFYEDKKMVFSVYEVKKRLFTVYENESFPPASNAIWYRDEYIPGLKK